MARALVAAVAVALSLLAVSGAGGAGAQTPKRGGTLVVGTLREPPCINAFLERCHGNTPPAELIMNLVLRGAFEIGLGFTWQPDLVSRVDFTTTPPFTLTYRIRPEARWSDGVPITARDFEFTHATSLKLPKEDRAYFPGLEFVRGVRVVDAKTVRVVLRSKYAGWRELFSNVLPRHALQGEDFSKVWPAEIRNPKTGSPIGSGPFLVADWERGRAVTFVRNSRYWGPHRSYLDRIVLRFCTRCADQVVEQIDLLGARELDLAMFLGPFAEQVQEFRRLPSVRVLTAPGPVWEHIDIRVRPGGHPALASKRIRRALAYALNRVAIARAYGAAGPDYGPSESAVLLAASPGHRANWKGYRHRPDEARRLLEQDGCRRGADRIYVCRGERLSLRFVTTAGSRERTLRLVREQLAQVGIAVEPIFTTIGILGAQVLPSGDFDLALFNWIYSSPNFSADTADFYGCDGRDNNSGYCQRLLTRDLDQARRILDNARLARVLNRADAQLARDVPVIPLVERPLLAAFDTSVRNVNLDTRAWNPFANAENWWLER